MGINTYKKKNLQKCFSCIHFTVQCMKGETMQRVSVQRVNDLHDGSFWAVDVDCKIFNL